MTSGVREIIARYEGQLLQRDMLSAYDRWALEYFRKPQIVDPHIEFTIQLDITDIAKSYKSRTETPSSSLTAYLTWGLLKALGVHPSFSWRSVGGSWYEFANLPLYYPVATGDGGVMQDILIEDASKTSWPEFVQRYRDHIERARSNRDFQPIPDEVFLLAWFIGNMPQLQFTACKVFLHSGRCGAPVFYFGKRYESAGRLLVPFFASLDHANAEPGRLEAAIAVFQSVLTKG